MGQFANICTAIIIIVLVRQAFLIPLDGSDGTPTADTSSRKGRCFTQIWNMFRTKAIEKIEQDVISVNPDNVRFFLYPDYRNPAYYEEIVYKDITTLQRSHYRFGAPWKILIHGYTMSKDGTFPQNVKNAYLEEYGRRLQRDGDLATQGYNVLVVDWAPLADPKLSGNSNFLFMYTFAVRNVQVVGERVGEMIYWLRVNGALETYNQVHVIGFSLGAHCAGNAGYTVFNMTGEKLPRVTGLDPAGPNFYLELKAISSPKLKKSAAKFVDVIHSNQGEFGTVSQLGHVDFYPNGGGPFQPFCYEKFNDVENKSMGDLGSCSHNRAPYFFSKSINSFQPALTACECENYEDFKNKCDCSNTAIMGEYCDPKTRGAYYLDLNDAEFPVAFSF